MPLFQSIEDIQISRELKTPRIEIEIRVYIIELFYQKEKIPLSLFLSRVA